MFSFIEQEFLSMLAEYNVAIWPLQFFAYALALTAIFFSLLKKPYSDRLILAILSLFWLWNGIVFSAVFWMNIYPYAYLFTIILSFQGLLFLYGLVRRKLSFSFRWNIYTAIAMIFILYSLVIYQLIGLGIGHEYPKFFAPGLTPCPTTIFTFGILLLSDKRFPNYFLIIPLLAALAGILAAANGIWEDYGLLIAGVLGSIMLYRKNKQFSTQ
jgi:hypothetical protein